MLVGESNRFLKAVSALQWIQIKHYYKLLNFALLMMAMALKKICNLVQYMVFSNVLKYFMIFEFVILFFQGVTQ